MQNSAEIVLDINKWADDGVKAGLWDKDIASSLKTDEFEKSGGVLNVNLMKTTYAKLEPTSVMYGSDDKTYCMKLTMYGGTEIDPINVLLSDEKYDQIISGRLPRMISNPNTSSNLDYNKNDFLVLSDYASEAFKAYEMKIVNGEIANNLSSDDKYFVDVTAFGKISGEVEPLPSDSEDDEDDEKKNFFESASEWFNSGKEEEKKIDLTAVSELIDIIDLVGTVIITLATMILGIKFMVSSAEGKSEVKQNLSTLLVACVFFFGWDSIKNLVFPDDNFFLTNGASDYKTMVAGVYSLAVFVLEIVAVIVIIYIGVKYIFSGATGKSNLKGKSAEFIIGIILTFCTISFLSYLSKVINDSLKTSDNSIQIIQQYETAKINESYKSVT